MNRKILIVDDHPAIRLAVQVLFEKNGDDIVGEAATGIDALALARTLSPDLIILDFLMPELDGLTVIERLLSTQTTTRILVFSQQTPSHLALRSMLVGAHGYLSKENPLTDLLQAADQIMAGQRYFPDIPETLLNSSLQDESALIKTLSPREFMVLLCLVEGQSNNDISKRMLLSNKTISTYKTRLLNKLNADSLVHLIELAQRHHLV